jgi:hypothetical protein
VNGTQGHERQEADVLADHAGRAVAHANSTRPRMEAPAESPGPLVRAIDDADGHVVSGAPGLTSSGKIGACSLAVVAIIERCPGTARVASRPAGIRVVTAAALVNVAITCGALPAPRYPAWPPAPDPKIRAAGDLGVEDRGRSAIGDALNTDGSALIWDVSVFISTVGHGGRVAGGGPTPGFFAMEISPIILNAGCTAQSSREAPVVARTHELYGPELLIGHLPSVDHWAALPILLL